MSIDLGIMAIVHAQASEFMDLVMVAITTMGSALVLAPLEIIFLCFLLSQRKIAIAGFLALAVGGGAVLNSVLKEYFLRPRPALWDTLVSEASYSFPSGHSMHTMVLLVSLGFVMQEEVKRAWWISAALFVFLVGFSRIYLGVHYPSDVLGGWFAGIAWAALCSLPLKNDNVTIFPDRKS
ncbi:phosphatase PAP2 family protein [Herbaspirillum camelliae]|uniref:phosphatase PAP2 family protein n=1 Tax=Herbaspirillum camelliae TaxID=1892903 RepID=UPI001300D0B4|nr:phosphatase PAP2 family protein [Herbaspirillum camelliae]